MFNLKLLASQKVISNLGVLKYHTIEHHTYTRPPNRTPPTHQPMNHHLPKVQHGLPTQQPNPTQPTRLPIFPIYAQAAKTAEKSENSDGGLVQNLTRFFNLRRMSAPSPSWTSKVSVREWGPPRSKTARTSTPYWDLAWSVQEDTVRARFEKVLVS